MPKKFQHGGILSCDPSFRGCAWSMVIPSRGVSMTRVYDITDGYRGYDKQELMYELVLRHLEQVLSDFAPFVWEVTYFVIEGQFKTKMIRLQTIVTAMVKAMFRGQLKKVKVVPAYVWRPFYGLDGDTYRGRKKLSVEFLSEHPKFWAWEEGIKDDNMAEAIILLNYCVAKHGLVFTPRMSTPNFKCKHCDSDCITKLCGPNSKPENVNKPYYACVNTSCPKSKPNPNTGAPMGGGFQCFYGEESKYRTGYGGKPVLKRDSATNPGSTPPPPKAAKVSSGSAPRDDPALVVLKNNSTIMMESLKGIEKLMTFMSTQITAINDKLSGQQPLTQEVSDDEQLAVAESDDESHSPYTQSNAYY